MATYTNLPEPDYTAILPGDTRLTWLNRTEPNYSWLSHPDTGEPVGVDPTDTDPYEGHIFLLISEAEFQLYKARLDIGLPPMWPGVEHVTFGEPVALTTRQTLVGPMHGITLAITAVDPKTMFYTYDTSRAYRHIGALAFVSDVGDVEQFQPLAFEQAIYGCRAMSVAAACQIMCASGLTGTATPWLRTS